MTEATLRFLDRLALAGSQSVARSFFRIGHDLRFTLLLCALLVSASLIACGFLQTRQDSLALRQQGARFEQARARDIAAAAGLILDRYARMGMVFSQSPEQYRSAELGRAEPAIRDIAVWDAAGAPLARLDAMAATPLPRPNFSGARSASADALAFRQGERTIVVRFDPATLAFPGATLAAGKHRNGQAAVPRWPLAVTVVADGAAPSGWMPGWLGSLPLYVLLVAAPAVAAAILAVLLVGAVESRAKAGRAIRALKSTRPVEGRLLVRLAQAERGAQEALRAKSEFMAHMSHELRTPLNAVIGFSDIIARDLYGEPGHPKYGEYARDIGHAGRALHARIGDILDFANIEAGHYPLTEEAVELADLARDCIADHEGRAFNRRISLSLAFGEPGQVRADRRALTRILSNLLANALTYTAEGGIVRADVRFEDGAGVLTLTDSGAGFSDAERGRAGRPFTRFDRPGTVTGQGLGLAIAMELTRRMGGAMRLTGQDGPSQGATMELRLRRL
jgi:two-component system cell cycle sensor histidine kinase PleC